MAAGIRTFGQIAKTMLEKSLFVASPSCILPDYSVLSPVLLPAVRDHWDCPTFSFPQNQLQITLIKDVEAEGGGGGGGAQVWLQFQMLLDFLFFPFFSLVFWLVISSHETHLQNGSKNGVKCSERGGERKKQRLKERCVESCVTDPVATFSLKVLRQQLWLCWEAKKMCQLSLTKVHLDCTESCWRMLGGGFSTYVCCV